MILKNPLHTWHKAYKEERSTLTLKPSADIIRCSKHGTSLPSNYLCPRKIEKKKKKYCSWYTNQTVKNVQQQTFYCDSSFMHILIKFYVRLCVFWSGRLVKVVANSHGINFQVIYETQTKHLKKDTCRDPWNQDFLKVRGSAVIFQFDWFSEKHDNKEIKASTLDKYFHRHSLSYVKVPVPVIKHTVKFLSAMTLTAIIHYHHDHHHSP